MRHELGLTLILLILAVVNLALRDEHKYRIIPWAVGLFAVNLLAGFLPGAYGTLFGGMYLMNEPVWLMKNILNTGTFIVFLFSAGWLRRELENKPRAADYFILLLSSLTGMFFMISSGHFLMFFIGLELATIPVAALAAFEQKVRRSAEAGVKLILLSTFSSAIMLFGISFLYGTTGSAYFDSMMSGIIGSPLQVLGFIFFFAGLAFKISIVPFHLWTADVYEGAPVNVSGFLSVVSKGAAVFILMILLFNVFRMIEGSWVKVLYVTSILTMTIGNLFALRQQNLKRFLAFSSIAQAGFILLGMIAGNALSMTVVLYFVFIYIFSNLAAFGVVSVIYNQTGREMMHDYNGLYRTNPKLSLVMMLAMFSLAGVPPVAGFFGKFFLFTAAASKGYYWLVIIGVVNATISLYYYLLVVKAMFINENEAPLAFFTTDHWARAGLVICALGILAVGFIGPLFDFMNRVALGF